MVVPGQTFQAILSYSHRQHAAFKMTEGLVTHKGGCHCGAVKFEARAPAVITVIDCNCSICVKKQNQHFIVPLTHFKLLQGHDCLKTYSFGSHKAKHYFCTTCGVQSFYIPKSNPDGYGVNINCIDSNTVKKTKVEKFDGKNWDEAIKKSSHIIEYSKTSP